MSKNHAVRLKHLETQMKRTEEELKCIQQEKQKKEIELQNNIRKIKILKRNAKKIIISEHALLRYLERVKLIDLASIKKEIITDKIVAAFAKLGTDGKYPSGTGYRVIIRDNTIVTIET